MDWLTKYHAANVCDEKINRIPYGDETLTIQGDRGESRLNIISCIKMYKYLHNGCHVFLAHLKEKKTGDKSEEKQLEDVPIVRDFLKVCPEDFLGLPPTRQVEFQLDLVPGAAPVARSPSPKTPHFHDDPLHESLHEDSTSQGSLSNVRPPHTPFEFIGRWTKDHPIENVIKDPSRSVSIRKQLETDAMWCYFDAFLTSVEPKNFKQAMTKPSWIDAMQEEIHEFERLQILFFLRLQISQSSRGIFLSQSKYASEIIKKYGLLTSDSVDTPMVEKNKLDEDLQGTPVDATLYRGMIRSLVYLTSSRPGLIYAVCLCLWYSKDTDMSLITYSDADHAGCQDTKRGTSGSTQFLGDKLVSWSSKKQKSTAFSNYGFTFNKIPLYCDNKSAIALCCNNVQHSRAKHIDVRYHFIKEQVENGIMELYFVQTEYQLADIFTKPLLRE
ncbi:hypothetical protein Tco_0651729 [Tanacetum coccineum]|uniref:Reverse transcriptase Ty1/copia-type domain-containing protein n=1 Tax=Tanacetum coccineum TaxID=301880 RepID=A0ABQ4WVX6_9ASTR